MKLEVWFVVITIDTLGNISMNCALDYLQSSTKHVALTFQEHSAVALQAEK
jgi:hypothetical protein